MDCDVWRLLTGVVETAAGGGWNTGGPPSLFLTGVLVTGVP